MVAQIDTIMQIHPDVQLIVFGEMTLGWYIPGTMPKYHREIAETIPGPTTEAVAAWARKHGIYVCFGISEVDEEVLYNTQVLLNPQGNFQAITTNGT
jgi:predicted amidohydrolase